MQGLKSTRVSVSKSKFGRGFVYFWKLIGGGYILEMIRCTLTENVFSTIEYRFGICLGYITLMSEIVLALNNLCITLAECTFEIAPFVVVFSILR